MCFLFCFSRELQDGEHSGQDLRLLHWWKFLFEMDQQSPEDKLQKCGGDGFRWFISMNSPMHFYAFGLAHFNNIQLDITAKCNRRAGPPCPFHALPFQKTCMQKLRYQQVERKASKSVMSKKCVKYIPGSLITGNN